MGDRLVVDMEGLIDLSASLARLTENLDATRRLIDGVREDLGSGDLWEALDDFENNWDDGRGQINKNMVAMGEVVVEAVDAYDQVDEDLRRQLEEQFTTQGSEA